MSTWKRTEPKFCKPREHRFPDRAWESHRSTTSMYADECNNCPALRVVQEFLIETNDIELTYEVHIRIVSLEIVSYVITKTVPWNTRHKMVQYFE